MLSADDVPPRALLSAAAPTREAVNARVGDSGTLYNFFSLRGTQRRCAALRAAPLGRYAPQALRAQPFLEVVEHEKKSLFLSTSF